MVERGARQVPGGALREDGHPRDDVGARLEIAEGLALAAAALVAAADADDATVLDEQPVGGRLGQHERAAGLRQLREVLRHLGDRDDPVAVVAERRRRWDPKRTLAREQVDALTRHLAVGRDPRQLLGAALEETPRGAGVHDGAGEQMRARLLALVDEGDRDLAEPFRRRRVLLEQLAEADRARETCRPASDDEDADLDALVGRVGRRRDHFGARERRRVVSGANLALATARPCGPARARRASGRPGSGRRRRRSRQSRRSGRSRPC